MCSRSLETFHAWLQMSASRPLIGQQTLHAEWHMFLPLMTPLQKLGDGTGGEEAWPSDLLVCQHPTSLQIFDPVFCRQNATTAPLHAEMKVLGS